MTDVRPGDMITAVYHRSDFRVVILMRVTKVGRKYIHGVTQFVEADGETRDGHEDMINMEDSTFYKGFRHDLRDAERQHRADVQDWNHRRNEKAKEFEWEIRELLRERMDAWKRDNPMPVRAELPTLGG